MTRTPKTRVLVKSVIRRSVALLLAGLSIAAGCSNADRRSASATTEPAATEPAATEPAATEPAATAPGRAALDPRVALDAAAEVASEFAEHWVAYLGSVVQGRPDASRAEAIAALHDPDHLGFDTAAFATCVETEVVAFRTATGSAEAATVGAPEWEHSVWRDHGAALDVAREPALSQMTLLDNLVAGPHDDSAFATLFVGPGGIVGHRLDGNDAAHAPIIGCVDTATTAAGGATSVDLVGLAADAERIAALDGNAGASSASFSVAAGGPGDRSADESAGGGEDLWLRRDGFPADPNDPEPIASTGSNHWDLITRDDPTAFVCVRALGQGPEEILLADKSGYEAVADAYLYDARFRDGTRIAVRVHPEIGSQADADAEVERYLVPLGQLPTVLRRDIERFAIRIGDNTATASPGEGIMVQTRNMDVRFADDRAEETLFHEAVHTSLDPNWSFQRSPEWLDAQIADGRWLTEYGREYPDQEDVAETALYGYVLARHPERFPAGVADEIAARVPNRLRLVDTIFPLDQPSIEPSDTPVGCG